jgi:hypothetical protein
MLRRLTGRLNKGGESPRNQNESELNMENLQTEYIGGFNDGFNYVLHEIESYIQKYPDNTFTLKELLQHLKADGDNVGVLVNKLENS